MSADFKVGCNDKYLSVSNTSNKHSSYVNKEENVITTNVCKVKKYNIQTPQYKD